MLDSVTLQRLAFIKYLYKTAVYQSQQGEPLMSTSILLFHDSVELFLQLASEHLDISKRDISLMSYWDILSKELPDGFPTQKESMRRLNSARVQLKHMGTLPSKLAIEGFRASVTNFFIENTLVVFKIDFEKISMIELVQCVATRDNLDKASKLQEQGNLDEALEFIAIAFAQLIGDYEDRKRSEYGKSPFDFLGIWGEHSIRSRHFIHHIDHDLQGFIDAVGEFIENAQDVLKILSLGINYRQYSKFRLLTPQIFKSMDGEYKAVEQRVVIGEPYMPTIDDVTFCYDFVIESALQLQEFDFDIEMSR